MVIIFFAVIDRTRFERVIALFEKRKKLPLYRELLHLNFY